MKLKTLNTILILLMVISMGALWYEKDIAPKRSHSKLAEQSQYTLGTMQPWTSDALQWAIKGHHKVFIHFTGEGCLDCKFQWALVDTYKLYQYSYSNNVYLFEGNLTPGKDNTFTLSELSKYSLGGVPGYVAIDSTGTNHVLDSRLWGTGTITSFLDHVK